MVHYNSATYLPILSEWLKNLKNTVRNAEIWVCAGSPEHWSWSIKYAFDYEPGFTYWGSRLENISELTELFKGRGGVVSASASLIKHYSLNKPNLVIFYANGIGIIGLGLVIAFEEGLFELFWPQERKEGKVIFPFRYKMRILWLHETVLNYPSDYRLWQGLPWPLTWAPRAGIQRIDRDAEKIKDELLKHLPKKEFSEKMFFKVETKAAGLEKLNLNIIEDLTKKSGLYYSRDVLVAAVAALRSGKHLLLMGAPATGKSMLARVLADALGFELYACTASSAWSRYDFIGGPVLGEGGRLEWRSGHLLRALARHLELRERKGRGVLFLVEELNRAEADKVLAEFFTMFPSSNLEEWMFPEGLVREIRSFKERGVVDEDAEKLLKYLGESGYRIPGDFRVVATVNTFDRAFLFTLGYALQRRFVVLELLPPESREEELGAVVAQLKRKGIDVEKGETKKIVEEAVDLIRALREATGRPLGLGITVDTAILAYEMVASKGVDDVGEAVQKAAVHTVLPQLELIGEEAEKIAEKLKEKYGKVAEEIRRIGVLRGI